MPKDFFQSFTVTSAFIPGGLSALVSGTGGGLSQSAKASKNASKVLTENSPNRNSLLKALQVLFAQDDLLDHSVLETYLDEVKEGLIATNDGVALIVKNFLLSMSSGVGHILQTPIDVSLSAKHIGNGLSHLEVPMDKLQEASHKAFLIDDHVKDSNGSAASMRSVSEAVSKQGGMVLEKIYEDVKIEDNSHAQAHANTASSSAAASIGLSAVIPSAGGVITDGIGYFFKEASAISQFSAHESDSAEEKNIYHASSGTAKATQKRDCQDTKLQSQQLEAVLSDMQPGVKLLANQSVTSPLSLALLRLIVLSLFVESSRGLNKTGIVTTEEGFQKALADATAQGLSAGVDRIKSLHSNLCALSNIMRLCAENLGGSPAVLTAVQISEAISSRSMSILLSHISELANALRLLVNPQLADMKCATSINLINSPVESAKPKVLKESAGTIQAVLDKIEKENALHVIPGLNQDMASQLNSTVHSGLSSLLTTHSLFTNPSVLAIKGSKKASLIDDAQKNEALIQTLPGITQSLNTLQAFTRNLMDEMNKAMVSDEASESQKTLFSTHQSANSNTATFFWALSALLLLSDEMLTICRSVSLIDKQRLQNLSQKVSALPTKDETAQSAQQISWDSHLEQDYSALHAISALRLTLSHTGIALMRIAMALHQALEDINTIKPDLVMHHLQESILSSTAYATRYLSEGLLMSTGGVSAFPVLLNGSINYSNHKVHTTDAHLHPAQTHESEHSSGGEFESSQSTGFSTDMAAGTLSNLFKVLAQTGIIGLDTTLQLIKILEILSLHRDSHVALKLETNDSVNPNGLSINTSNRPSVGASAGISAILINMLDALQTVDKSSKTHTTLNAQNKLKDVIDQQIENLAVLKDEEEIRANKKGLKEFYRVIIRLLFPNQEAAYDNLIKRLDFGGISLSSYHSLFGAYDNQLVDNSRFLAFFANNDTAQDILQKFIDKAKKKYSLFKSLHDALPLEQRSKKAEILYEHVFEALFQHYKQVKMSDVAKHGATKRKIPTRDVFQMDIGLIPLPQTMQVAVHEDLERIDPNTNPNARGVSFTQQLT